MFEIFQDVYDTEDWGDGSGPGSAPAGLGPYYEFLERILRERQPRSIIDLGCGFFSPYARIDWGDVHYLGIDVVEACIADNSRYANPNRTFLHGDWCNMDKLPDADFAICKDVLQHWCHADIRKGLTRLLKYRWVLITNSIVCGNRRLNAEISTGDVRALDLLQEPYSLQATESKIYEVITNCEPDLKLIFLWEPQPSAHCLKLPL